MARSSVNDAAREMMAALAKWYGDMNGSLVTTGTGAAYVLTTNAADAALNDTSLLVFRAHAANSAAPTLNRDGLGAKTIKTVAGADLPAGVIAANQLVTASYNATTDSYNLHSGINTRVIGEAVDYTGPTAPQGWIFGFGQALSRTTYSAYFALIGTTYGAGDGSTTFNVPDLRGRVVAGLDNMGGTAASRLTSFPGGLGGAGGAQTHLLTSAESGMPAHNVSINTVDSNATGGTSGFWFGNRADAADQVVAIGAQNAASAHTIVQPTIFLNKIIYVGV